MSETDEAADEPNRRAASSAARSKRSIAAWRSLDAATRSRLDAARDRALQELGRRTRRSAGDGRSRRRRVAAAAVAAVLAARAASARRARLASRVARRSRDPARRTRISRCSTRTWISTLGSRSSPSSRRRPRATMAWADAQSRGGPTVLAASRAGRGSTAAPRRRRRRARAAGAPPNGAPDLEFLEYLGSWQADDDEWLEIERMGQGSPRAEGRCGASRRRRAGEDDRAARRDERETTMNKSQVDSARSSCALALLAGVGSRAGRRVGRLERRAASAARAAGADTGRISIPRARSRLRAARSAGWK